jgi:hypothetical protein
MFRIGIRDSRHFLPAFLNTFHMHTIDRMKSANQTIHQNAHPELDVP